MERASIERANKGTEEIVVLWQAKANCSWNENAAHLQSGHKPVHRALECHVKKKYPLSGLSSRFAQT